MNKLLLRINYLNKIIVLNILKLINTIDYTFSKKENIILINGWLHINLGKVAHNNWGDDINFYLIKLLSKKKVINISDTYLSSSHKHILGIGSIVEKYSKSGSVLWGTGAMYGRENDCIVKPNRIKAVRGKLTRRYLLCQGIDCPKVYGDPALLLPLIYKPQKEKKYKVGLIPHYVDIDSEKVKKFLRRYKEVCTIINLKNYRCWTDIIDSISQCEIILSSSLHGLITSDAYNIPNIWIKITDKIGGGDFKYLDYFSGVGRKTTNPIDIEFFSSIEQIFMEAKKWRPIEFDSKYLTEVAPFPISL